MVNLFLTIIRSLFALIDSIVVWAIKNLYVLLVEIANTNVFGDFIYQMLGRIYVFLGVFMLFKLSMSMITYIINPDSFTDKNKGFSKLITNVIISLILIVTVPTIFKEAFKLQALILNSNAIYQIVTGRELPTNNSGNSKTQLEDNANKLGNQIATGVFQSFIYEYQSEDDVTKLVVKMPVTEEKTPGATNDSGVWRCNANSVNSSSCMVAIATVTMDGDGANGFANEYRFLLSTICGGVVAYFFLLFCLDAAVRAIKLGVLQIIAPIPILSLIDPKTGTEKLKKWGSECGKEFASLFIRLAGVFFAVSIIQIVMGTYGGVTGAMTYYDADGTIGGAGSSVNMFVRLFIIIGALLFAKELPKWLDGVLGTNLASNSGAFNLKKKIGGALGGAALLGGGAMLGRAASTLGRDASNTLNASARLGASSLKNKITGKDNRDAVDRFKQRMNYNGKEMLGRAKSLNKKYSGDTMSSLYKKSVGDEKAATKAYERGEMLYKQANEYKASGKSEYDIYSNESFRNAAELMDKAKDQRNHAQEAYDIAQTRFQRGEISSEEFSRIRLDSINATSAYDKAKAAFDEQSKIHSSDAEKYKLYSATADRYKAEKSVTGSSAPSSQSTSSSQSTYETVGGVRVSKPNANGERTTASGIILSSGVKTDQEK